MTSAVGAKRVRRTSEEARRQILDAAEARLTSLGPEGLRLQDIGRDVGLSHSAILHHFESRDGLVRALALRATEQLKRDVLAALAPPAGGGPEATVIMQKVFEVLSERGYARLAAWLTLEHGHDNRRFSEQMIAELIRVIHDMRVAYAGEEGKPVPAEEDTANIVLLVASAAYGDGIMGQTLRLAAGRDGSPEARSRFRAWFGRLIEGHMDHYGEGDAPADASQP
ncbi:TetR/AcrR family transcriptional regulator [Zavarzinia compransoris]|nr:TetR/AcrR family transcriptional regulator [Zavarzinia compransoris]TDP49120.1 TetR family transcriptional regulator [Zavarzinia compransoris]